MLWFFLIFALLLGAVGGLYWRWKQNIEAEIAEGAAIEWAHYQKNEPEFLKGMSEEAFRDVYARVHTPRFPGYALAMAATFLVSLPLTFIALTGGLLIADRAGILPEPLEIVRYVRLGEAKPVQPWQCDAQCQLYVAEAYSGFYYFFGVLVVWLLIVAIYMRRFHARRPGYMRDEIIRARE